jgi:hypothetical protein
MRMSDQKGDAKETLGEAKDAIVEKAKDLAAEVSERVKVLIDEHGDKIDNAVDKTATYVDDKTGGRYTDKITRAQDAVKNAAAKLGSEANRPGGTSGTAASPSSEPDADEPGTGSAGTGTAG